jgi:MurNAc alpha-1-phosphate uridylyltransferase
MANPLPMPPTQHKAMILAAGLGERMRPLTEHTPKPLLVAGGKPLIIWQIERLRRAGFVDLVINHAHLGMKIESALGDGGALGVRIAWSDEGTPLETAGGIAKALHLLGDAPFLVTNGDVYTEFDYARLRAVLDAMVRAPEHLAHLVLVDNPPHHPQGDFILEAGKVAQPPTHATGSLTFSGIGCYRPELFAGIVPGDKARLAPLLHRSMLTGGVTGEHFQGRWADIGTPQRLADLDAELKELRHAA